MADYFVTVALTKPATPEVRDAALAVIARAEAAMPWAAGMQSQAAGYLAAGKWPRPVTVDVVSADPAQQAQWKQFLDAYAPLNRAVVAGEWQLAKAEGNRLAQNTALWDGIYRATAAVATLGVSELWNKLEKMLNEYRQARVAVLASVRIMDQTSTAPAYAQVRAKATQYAANLKSQLNETDEAAKRALGPLSNQATVKAQAGLGAVPAFVLPLTTAALGAIISAFAGYAVKRIFDLKEQASANAQEILRERQQIANDLLKTGKIDAQQWQNMNSENSAMADRQREAQGSIGLFSGKAAAVVLGVAALAFGGWYLLNRRARA